MSEELFQRLSRLVSATTHGLLRKNTGRSAGIGEFMLNDQMASAIYGSADDFMQQQKQFEDQYYRMLAEPENLKPGMANVVDVDHIRKMGKIDFSYFNFQAKRTLMGQYRQNVLQLDKLISNVGFPSIMLPEGANDVRLGVLFDIDQKMEHPVFTVLNKMIFNVDPMSESISDMTFNTQNIMSSSQIQRNMAQMSALSNGTLFTQTSKIATIDIESTGLMFGSQARSLSLIQRTGLDAAAGQISAPGFEDIDFMFRSPRLSGVLASESMTLTDLIAEQEGFARTGNIIGNEDEFMEKMTKLFGYLSDENNVDFLTGHNIGYDINTLLDTTRSMKGYGQNKALNTVVDKFLDRVNNNPTFMVDTLEIGRQYMRNILQENMDPQLDSIARGQQFVKSFFAEETLADISRGGKATYAAMENFIMNTNLLDLVAAEDHAPAVFEKIFGGSHVAETDTMLQDYMLKYIHQGKLDFRKQHSTVQGKKIAEEEINIARLTALKSSAIVPEANISDPQQLSQAALRYIQTDEGLTGARVMITAEQAKASFGIESLGKVLDELGVEQEVQSGFIKYDKGKHDKGSYKIFTGAGNPIELDNAQAKTYLRDVITKAQDSSYERVINLNASALRINPFEKQIMSLGLTRRENSNILIAQHLIDQIGMPTNIGSVDVDSYIHNVGNFYENFADNPRVIGDPAGGKLRSAMQQVASLMNPKPTFSMGFNMNARSASQILAEYVSHGQTMSGLGMANAIFSPTELAFGDLMSRATAGVARGRMGSLDPQVNPLPDKESAILRSSMRYAASQEIGDVVSQFGITHFQFQDTLRIMESQTQKSLGKKLILPYEYFKSIELASDSGAANMGEAIAQGKVNMSLSYVNKTITSPTTGQDEVHNILNLTWQESRDDSGLTSRRIAEKLYEDFIETDNYKNIIKEPGDRLRSEIENLKTLFSDKTPEGRASAILELEGLAKRGIVAGYMQDMGADSPIAKLVQNAGSMGVDLTRDTGNKMLGNIIDDSTGVLRAFFFDETTARATTPSGTTFTRNMHAIAKASVKGANDVAERLSGDSDLLKTAMQNIKAGTRKQDISKSVEVYNNIKPHAGLIALGAAAMIGGYYLTKKKDERDLYNKTLEQQPVETYNQNNVINAYTSSITSLPSSRRDPLVTAGVVGNLDRNKIGHTKMGNNKYNHLYGGQ